MYKAIRELWLSQALPKNPALPLRFPNVKSFIALLTVNCAVLVRIASKYSARQDLGGEDRMWCSYKEVFLLILHFPQCLH